MNDFENSENGLLSNPDWYVNIPTDKYKQTHDLLSEMGGSIKFEYPFLPGVEPTVKDSFKQYLNRIWMPQLTLIGIDGVPGTKEAGNVLRPSTTFGLSLRLPPTLDSKKAELLINDFA